MSKKKKATESKLSELHGIVADKLTAELNRAEVDLKVLDLAMRFLKDNKIQADIEFNEELKTIADSINKVDVTTLPFPKIN